MDGDSSKKHCNTIPEVKSVTVDSNHTGPIVGSLIDVDTDTATVAMKQIEPLVTATTTTAITTCTPHPIPNTAASLTIMSKTSGTKEPSQGSQLNQDLESLLQNDLSHAAVDINMDGLNIGDKSGQNATLVVDNNALVKQNYAELQKSYDQIKLDKIELQGQVESLTKQLESCKTELDREVQRRVDLEQRYTEEAKRASDQIETLTAKADQDDAKYNELKRKFDMYTRETSSMIENFITNRELLASQLIDMRRENDHLLGKYLSKASDLQNAEINLPQTVEDLQFYCLTLNEKLILATLAKERLEEAMVQNSANALGITTPTTTSHAPPTTTST